MLMPRLTKSLIDTILYLLYFKLYILNNIYTKSILVLAFLVFLLAFGYNNTYKLEVFYNFFIKGIKSIILTILLAVLEVRDN
jgi:hypothetical protein